MGALLSLLVAFLLCSYSNSAARTAGSSEFQKAMTFSGMMPPW
jgi:hypothetical protein